MTLQVGPITGAVYEERLVAFMDILGFSNLVKQSTNNESVQQRLYEFLRQYSKNEHAKKVFCGFRNGDGSRCGDEDIEGLKTLYNYRFTQFSDSFVFSVNTMHRPSVQYFPLLIGQFMQHALELGFLVRGGVAKGLIVHEENGPVFGPAFIQAYKIESGQAVFGRTVLSNEAFECISKSGIYSSSWMDKGLDDEYEITIASFLKQQYSSPLVESETRSAALSQATQKIMQVLDALEGSERDRVGGKYRYVISRLRHAMEEAKATIERED